MNKKEVEKYNKFKEKLWNTMMEKWKKDMKILEKELAKDTPKIFRFLMRFSERERKIFFRAWWMGFFAGEDYLKELFLYLFGDKNGKT